MLLISYYFIIRKKSSVRQSAFAGNFGIPFDFGFPYCLSFINFLSGLRDQTKKQTMGRHPPLVIIRERLANRKSHFQIPGTGVPSDVKTL